MSHQGKNGHSAEEVQRLQDSVATKFLVKCITQLPALKDGESLSDGKDVTCFCAWHVAPCMQIRVGVDKVWVWLPRPCRSCSTL